MARVNGEPITAEEIDAPLRLKLFDLDRARYEMRVVRLEQMVAERSGESPAEASVEILLEPPEPPRIAVGVDDDRIRGDPDAPVTIVEFLDYQSPYCRRMQPTLLRILDRFGDRVRLAVRDLPLPFHRDAPLAAEAAACAGEQGSFWAFHDVLLQEQGSLAREDLDGYARRLDLDTDRFTLCLATRRYASDVAADAEAARRHGVSLVPTFFVNGLYLKGPQSFETLERFVVRELERLGLPHAGASEGGSDLDEVSLRDARASDLSLALVGTIVATDTERSLAAIRLPSEEVARVFRIGDSVLEDVRLVAVRPARAYLRHGEALEFLTLEDAVRPYTLVGAGPPPEVVLTVPREQVIAGLEDRQALEERTELAPLDVDGRRLVKRTEVPAGSLFDRLGLQPGDVLMLVDGEWVHDRRNPLWEALEKQDEVTLVIMRKGFPKSFKYVIE